MVAGSKGSKSQSCDGQAVHKLAAKFAGMARSKPSGDKAVDLRQQMEHDNMVRVVDRMLKDPRAITHIHSFSMSLDVDQMDGAVAKASGEWTGSYRTMERIPKSWLTQYLLNRAKALFVDGLLSSDILCKVEEHSSDQLGILFAYETQCPGTVTFPEALSDKAICSKACALRAAEVGDQLAYLVRVGGFAVPGVVDYSKACFDPVFDETTGFLKEIKSVMGDTSEAIPECIRIDKTFKVVNGHLDHMAMFAKGVAKYVIADFFGDNAKFKKVMHTKKFSRMKAIGEELVANAKKRRRKLQPKSCRRTQPSYMQPRKSDHRRAWPRPGSSWMLASRAGRSSGLRTSLDEARF